MAEGERTQFLISKLTQDISDEEYYTILNSITIEIPSYFNIDLIFRGEILDYSEKVPDDFLKLAIEYMWNDEKNKSNYHYLEYTVTTRVELRKLYSVWKVKAKNNITIMIERFILRYSYKYIIEDYNYNRNIKLQFIYNIDKYENFRCINRHALINNNHLTQQIAAFLFDEKRVEQIGLHYIKRMTEPIDFTWFVSDKEYYQKIIYLLVDGRFNNIDLIFRGETCYIPERATNSFIHLVLNHYCLDYTYKDYIKMRYMYLTAMNGSIYLRKLCGFLNYKSPKVRSMLYEAIMKCAFHYINLDNEYNYELRMKFIYNFTKSDPEYYEKNKKLVNRNHLCYQLLTSICDKQRMERLGRLHVQCMILPIEYNKSIIE